MKTASDIMTPGPAWCAPDTPLEGVAKLMVQHNCGEIPVVDVDGQLIGVVTDRDIVCRPLATGKNPLDQWQPAITVHPDTTLADVMATMERHQIRRVPVVDDQERCVGIVAQADLAWAGPQKRRGGAGAGSVAQLISPRVTSVLGVPRQMACCRFRVAARRWPTDAPLRSSGRSNSK
jgi:CBS domain-containing protein